MARIYKRGKTWYCQIRIDGKEVRKALSTNHRIAEERLGDLVRQRNAKRHGHVPADMSWEAFKIEFLETSQHEKHRSTWLAEVRAFREMESVTPIQKLDQISPVFLDRVKTRWLKLGRGKYVINRDLRSIRGALRKAEAYGYVAKQDWTTNKYIKTSRGRLHFFSAAELLQLRSVCQGVWRTILYLGSRAGLRRDEMRMLPWQEIDFERNRIHIAPTGEWTPKDYQRRFIPMADDLREYLHNLKDKHEYVLAENGERPSLGSMTTYFKRLVRKAGLKGSIHTLRHTFGSHLASGGAPPTAIQAMMGHSKLEMTEIYMHLVPGTTESAVTRLPKIG